jgi:hypothetical protein
MRKFKRIKKSILSKRGRIIISYRAELNEKMRRQEYATNILNSIFI